MKRLFKVVLAIIILMILGLSFLFAIQHDLHFKVFLAESIIDNGVFCLFFLLVMYITGISC